MRLTAERDENQTSQLFTEVIVPDQRLAALFDVIVNSYDHRTTDKTQLWPVAFQQ